VALEVPGWYRSSMQFDMPHGLTFLKGAKRVTCTTMDGVVTRHLVRECKLDRTLSPHLQVKMPRGVGTGGPLGLAH
jgi:hypothetical protein